MPKRYITIPSPVTILDPATRTPALEDDKPIVYDLGTVISKLAMNPKWIETLANMRSLAAIEDEWKKAQGYGPGAVLELAEEDWQKLKDAVETPRMMVAGGVIPGLGLLPGVAPQLLPLLIPIVDATTTRPPEPVAPGRPG